MSKHREIIIKKNMFALENKMIVQKGGLHITVHNNAHNKPS